MRCPATPRPPAHRCLNCRDCKAGYPPVPSRSRATAGSLPAEWADGIPTSRAFAHETWFAPTRTMRRPSSRPMRARSARSILVGQVTIQPPGNAPNISAACLSIFECLSGASPHHMGNRFPQHRLDGPGLVAEVPPGLLDGKRRRPAGDPDALDRRRGRTDGRQSALNSIIAATSSASRPGTGTKSLRRPLMDAINARTSPSGHAIATKNVAVPDPAFFHRKDKANGDIAHIDEIHHEIEIHLHGPDAKKVLQHGGWRREIVVVRADRHGGAAERSRESPMRQPLKPGCPRAFSNAYRDPASRRPTARLLPPQGRPAGTVGKGCDSVEQCKKRATPHWRAALRTFLVPTKLTA